MKDETRKRIGKSTWIISIILLIAVGLFIFLTTNEPFIQRDFQRTICKMDNSMQQLIEKGLNHEELEKCNTGLTVFMNDTLVFWNRNDASPKLMKRKVVVGRDTICPLLTGNYFIKSYQNGTMTYYVYRLVNTTYPIENKYFDNHLNNLPPFIDANISLTEDGGTKLTNCDGKVLANYTIAKKPRLKQPYRTIWPIPILLLLIIGLILTYRKTTSEQHKEEKKTRVVEFGIASILLVSIVGTIIYYKFSVNRENEQMEQLAQRLVEKRDIDFEESYANFAKQLQTDTTLREMLFAESNVLTDVILGYTKELVFDTTMQTYQTTLTLCSPEEEINIEPEGYVIDCDKYFLEKLANNKQKKVGNGLYFLDYYTLDPNYLGKILISSKDNQQKKTLYFEFYKPIAPEGFGFPQLLQETNSQKPYQYSVASYRDDQLVYKYGRYVYPSFLNSLKIKNKNIAYSKNYKHYAIIDDEHNALVISTPTMKFSEKVSPFAIFFLGLSIPFLLIVWLCRPKGDKKRKTFRRRLQTIIFLTLGIALIAIGPVSIVYMQTLYNQKTEATQFETTRTLMIEMSNDLDIAELLRTATRDTWNRILQQYATAFFTDINLYHSNGQLLATTRPEIYELHLQAPIMNAEAYQNIHRNKELYYTHDEHLGKGKYASAYIPLNDVNGNTLAYLNTPYFSSNTDLHNEIKNFVLTYINIILVLLGVAIVVILHLTKRITQPLALIQSNLSKYELIGKNEPIEYKGEDEIGQLVQEYNNLIVKLHKSVEELKRTTTESAWRGVARQVAHEIKNSLTPMRLSIQMLQRNMENGKATTEQIQRTNNTLIEQIDALSDIASSFSSYAKLPENHPQPLDLAELVGNVVNFYDNVGNITFTYNYDPNQNHTFNGDKTNLNSAVTNVVKNAVQAIGSKQEGRIDVSLTTTENTFVIRVKDNGKGIKEEDKDKIFLPNFTTKTGGSGVGLSLTYNIIITAGGTISFESTEGEGAEFIIELPKK
jgi:signal transduction histidine kinase